MKTETKKLRAFAVQLPCYKDPAVVLEESAGKARYALYMHYRGLGPHMLRAGCGLYTYRLSDFTCRRLPEFDSLAYYGRKCWDYGYATTELELVARYSRMTLGPTQQVGLQRIPCPKCAGSRGVLYEGVEVVCAECQRDNTGR